MKSKCRAGVLGLAVGAWLGLAGPAGAEEADWAGAWRSEEGGRQQVLLWVDGLMSVTEFEAAPAAFGRTWGGPGVATGDVVEGRIHFDSAEAGRVGGTWRWRLAVTRAGAEETLRVEREDGRVEHWRRVPETVGPLTGVWRIAGRQRDGGLQEMPLRARRTLKVLSGSRFQWIAMNIESGEFSGTGGGTYTFRDGVYVETIEFFSRDASRVGARLEFTGELDEAGRWQHRGLSSRGDPIHEVWTRFNAAE